MYVICLPTKLRSCNGSLDVAIKPKAGGSIRKVLIFLLYIAFATPVALLLIVRN
jgi:hypothetical protein